MSIDNPQVNTTSPVLNKNSFHSVKINSVSETIYTNTRLSNPLSIELVDSEGQVINTTVDAWAPITINLFSGTGSLSGTTTVYAVLGKATFEDIQFDTPGIKKITANKLDYSLYGGSVSSTSISSDITVSSKILFASSILVSGTSAASPADCIHYQIIPIDSFGNSARVSQTINLNARSTLHGQFYSDNQCSNALSQLTLTSSDSSQSIYYQNLGQEPDRIYFSTNDNTFSTYKDISLSTLTIKQFYGSATTSTSDLNQNPFSCTLYTNGTAQCVQVFPDETKGPNFSVQPKIYKLPSSSIIDLALGADHVCAKDNLNQLYCWGSNTSGQVGNNTRINQTSPQLINLGGSLVNFTSGYGFTCATVLISANHVIKCWGDNTGYRLGNNNTMYPFSTVPITVDYTIPNGVFINKLRYSKNTYNASIQLFAITTTQQIIFWGGLSSQSYASARPKINTAISNALDIFRTSASYVTLLLNDGTVGQIYNIFSTTTTPTPVSNINNITQLEASYYNDTLCGLNSSQSIICWGTDVPLIHNEYYSSIYEQQINSIYPGSRIVNYGDLICGVENDGKNVICWSDKQKIQIKNLNLTHAYQSLQVTSTQNLYSIDNNQCIELKIENTNNGISSAIKDNLIVSLTDASSTGSFFSDNNCLNSINQILLLGYQTEQKVYFKGLNNTNMPKVITLKATSNHNSVGHAQLKLKYFGDVYKMYLSNIPSMYTITLCSPISLQFKDLDGVIRPLSSNLHIDITSAIDGDFSTTQFKNYNDAGCTTPITQVDLTTSISQKTIYIKSNVVPACGPDYSFESYYATTPILTGTQQLYLDNYDVCYGN